MTFDEILARRSVSAGWPPGGYEAVGRTCSAHARNFKQQGHEAYVLRLLGAVAAHREPPEADQAEAYYLQALSLAEELGMRPLQAHCHLGLGTLYLTLETARAACAPLSTAIDLYRAMEITFWLLQAEATLAQVSALA